jgi:hypothetical protein
MITSSRAYARELLNRELAVNNKPPLRNKMKAWKKGTDLLLFLIEQGRLHPTDPAC